MVSSRAFKFKNLIIQIISGSTILLFVYTGLNKLEAIGDFEHVLNKSPILHRFSTFLAWVIPIVELCISLVLIFPKTRYIGFLSAFIIMLLFTLYVGYMIMFIPKLPCNCGGIMRALSWKQHLVFNAVFTVLIFVALIAQKKKGFI